MKIKYPSNSLMSMFKTRQQQVWRISPDAKNFCKKQRGLGIYYALSQSPCFLLLAGISYPHAGIEKMYALCYAGDCSWY
jgi:hypothetical protein